MKRTLIATIALAAALTVSGTAAPADAATNWLRECSTVKSHPVSTACTITLPGGKYTSIQYRDTKRVLHTIHSASTAWSWLRTHSVKCRPYSNDVSCYGTDVVMGIRMFTDARGRHVALSRIR